MVRRFADPDEYVDCLRWTKVDVTITAPGRFASKLTRIDLHRVMAHRFSEPLPRVAHIDRAPGRALIYFPTASGSRFFAGAAEVPHNGLIRYQYTGRSFQRTTGSARLASLSLPIEDMEALGASFGGSDFTPPRETLIITPPSAAMERLQSLHRAAGHLAEYAPDVIANPEAARGLEQALLAALADCLRAAKGREPESASRHHDGIMRRFFAMLEANAGVVLYAPEMCKALRISNRTLTTCCNDALGMSPHRYLRLRQMNLAHRALARADPRTATVTEIATAHGFWDLGRFATAHRALFAEPPSVALRRSQEIPLIAQGLANSLPSSEFT
jgi:AraC-like DNA-binding protein